MFRHGLYSPDGLHVGQALLTYLRHSVFEREKLFCLSDVALIAVIGGRSKGLIFGRGRHDKSMGEKVSIHWKIYLPYGEQTIVLLMYRIKCLVQAIFLVKNWHKPTNLFWANSEQKV